MTKKKRGTVDAIAEECLAVRMRMLNRVITKIYDDSLRPHGLKVSQMNILTAIGKMGTAPPAEICRRLHLDVSTLSRNVDRMKARGWIEVVETEDRREQPLRLTREGRKLLDQAMLGWRSAQKKAKAVLGDDGSKALSAALRRIDDLS